MVTTPDRQRRTIKGVLPHIEANIFSMYETTHDSLIPDLKGKRWIHLKAVAHHRVHQQLR
jgi:hypothetical protein